MLPLNRRGSFVLAGAALAALCATAGGIVVMRHRRPAEPARDAHGFAAKPAPPAFTGEPRSGSVVPLGRTLMVDQFGYRPRDEKVAVAIDAKEGAPYQIRRWEDGSVASDVQANVWNGGALDELSGDRGAWVDFSGLHEPGAYFVYDPRTRERSRRFRIAEDVYRDVLRAAMRMFYFNRANVAKRAPEACVAGKCWTQGASYLKRGQDSEARSVRARDDPRSARDLSGGWWDAGDVNKYVTNAALPVNQLLSAYTENPAAFGDDFDIPESKNGVPDVLDELLVELAWLERMQPADLGGGVLLKVGNLDFGDPVPEASELPRYYYPESCSASTIAAAGMFAHAALVFAKLPRFAERAREFAARAERALAHYHSHPQRSDCDDGTIKSGDSDRSLEDQTGESVVAAVYLFALTHEARYGEYVTKNVEKTRPFRDPLWSVYDAEQGDALLAYAALPDADEPTKTKILAKKSGDAGVSEIYGFRPALDLYRGYLGRDSYHWGSNMIRANYGNTNYDFVTYALVPGHQRDDFRRRAVELLHTFHGVNPLGLVYLSQMQAYGAETSVSEIFHAWFRDGDPRWDSALVSSLGPAPGYVVGGPNARYCQGEDSKTARCRGSELVRLPPAKMYRDFNTGYAPELEYDRSWELSEPSITYQGAYVKLLSKFVGTSTF